jgi:predicted MFS family arabinose efflux permease
MHAWTNRRSRSDAPVAIAVDSISYLVDAALNASIHVHEPRADTHKRDLRAEVRDGLHWTYSHPTLGPLALSTHLWFLANGAALTVLSLLALRSQGFTATAFGTLLAVFGVTTLIGASLAPRCGGWMGPARAVILARSVYIPSRGFSWPSPQPEAPAPGCCSLH